VFLLVAVASPLAAQDGKKEATPREPLDTVELKDGTVHSGKLTDAGGNSVELEVGGGKKRIHKGQIQKFVFARGRRETRKLDADLVILAANDHEVHGKVTEIAGGTKVQVTLDDGSQVVYPRTSIKKILRRDEVMIAARYYTQELEERIDAALASLRAGGSGADGDIVQIERRLIGWGVFAVDRVRAEIERLDAAGSPAIVRASLRRVLRAYMLREVVPTEVETECPSVYETLTYGEPSQRVSLLKAVYPTFQDSTVELALCLIRDPDEDESIRALSIEVLRRLQRNRALLALYNESQGKLKFVAAVALANNRILFGAPTLLEGLELADARMREVADLALRRATGQNFHFRADGAPAAREQAVSRWRAWWEENRKAVEEASMALLNQRDPDSAEWRQAVELWQAAHGFWAKNDPARAELLLKQAVEAEPSFIKATISLAVLLTTELDRAAEAEETLSGLLRRLPPNASDADRHWIYLELGHIEFSLGRAADALSYYEEALAFEPASVPASVGVARCQWEIASKDRELSPADRRVKLTDTVRSYQEARALIEKTARGLQGLRAEALPEADVLPFERRAHNRSVFDVREGHERLLVEVLLETAKVWSVLEEDRTKAILILREALDSLKLSDDVEEVKPLEAKVRTFLGLTYEALGKAPLAYEEYSKVLRDLEPRDETCREAVERLRAKVLRRARETAPKG
jgi:tetratricopeptide (TPR) repeat protein